MAQDDIIKRLTESINKLTSKIEETNKFNNLYIRDSITTSLNDAYTKLSDGLKQQVDLITTLAKHVDATQGEVKEVLDLEIEKGKLNERLKKAGLSADGATAIQNRIARIESKLNEHHFRLSDTDIEKYYKLLNEELSLREKISDQEGKSEALNKKIASWNEKISKFVRATVETLSPGVKKWHEMDKLSKATARSMGMTAAKSEAYMKYLGDSARKLAYNYGMTVEEVDKMQNAIVKASNRSAMLNEMQQENLIAMSKLGGSEVAEQFLDAVEKFGGSSDSAVKSFGQAYGSAMKLGLNAQKASAAVAKNMALLNTYAFKNGVDGITKMTMLAQKLRIDLTSAAKVVDKFENIDDAIKTTAQMQVLGGVGGMMFGNALENFSQALIDPEAIIEKVTKITAGKGTFNRATGMVDIGAFDKRMIREQAKALGISHEELMTMANQIARNKEIEKDIRSTSVGKSLSEEQLSLLQNKASWDKQSQSFKITYFDKEGNKVEKSVKELMSMDVESQKQMFSDLAKETDIQELIQGDVRRIAQTLVDRESKNKGFKEQWAVANAQVLDGPIRLFYDAVDTFANSDFWKYLTGGGFVTALGMAGLFGKNLFGRKLIHQIARNLMGKVGGNGGSTYTPGASFSKPKPRILGAINSGGYQYTRVQSSNGSIRYYKREILPNNAGLGKAVQIKNGKSVWQTLTPTPPTPPPTPPAPPTPPTTPTARPRARASRVKSRWKTLAKMHKISKGAKIAGGVGAILDAAYGLYNAYSNEKQDTAQLDSLNLNPKDRDAIEKEIGNKAFKAKGNAITSAVLAGIGGTLGAAFGGPIGSIAFGALGGYIGDRIGASIFGNDNRSTSDMVQEYSETTKFGKNAYSATGQILQDNAARATIKMHDILVSIWYHMNGRQSNGAIENKGIIGNLKEGNLLGAVGSIFQTFFQTSSDKESKAHYFGENAEGGMVDKRIAIPKSIRDAMDSKGEDGIAAVKKNELIVTPSQMQNLSSMIAQKSNVVSKPTVGTKVRVEPNVPTPSVQMKDLNVNINGTLKLDGSALGVNGMKLDMNALMNNPAFKAQIVEMVKNSMVTINGKALRDSRMNKLGNIQAYGGF